jgi:hypothetical protein
MRQFCVEKLHSLGDAASLRGVRARTWGFNDGTVRTIAIGENHSVIADFPTREFVFVAQSRMAPTTLLDCVQWRQA